MRSLKKKLFGTSSESFLSMLTDLKLDDKIKKKCLVENNAYCRAMHFLYFLSTKQKLDEPRFTYLLKCDPLDIELTIIVTSFLFLGCMYVKTIFLLYSFNIMQTRQLYTVLYSEVYYCILNLLLS